VKAISHFASSTWQQPENSPHHRLSRIGVCVCWTGHTLCVTAHLRMHSTTRLPCWGCQGVGSIACGMRRLIYIHRFSSPRRFTPFPTYQVPFIPTVFLFSCLHMLSTVFIFVFVAACLLGFVFHIYFLCLTDGRYCHGSVWKYIVISTQFIWRKPLFHCCTHAKSKWFLPTHTIVRLLTWTDW